jgi:hypothetical protein
MENTMATIFFSDMIISPDSADDLIPEESPEMQLALKRLSPKEAYDRVFRMRRAFQVFPPTTRVEAEMERTETGYERHRRTDS